MCFRLSKQWSAYAKNATIHGIRDKHEAQGLVSKTAWAIAIIAAGILFTCQAFTVVKSWLNEETGTEVSSWSPAEIPVLNICPFNYLNIERVRHNFPRASEYESGLLLAFIDSFVAAGSQMKALLGVVKAEDWTNGGKFAENVGQTAAQLAVKRWGIWEKYDGYLDRAMIENSWRREEIIHSVESSPLAFDEVKFTTEASWQGVCFVLEFVRNSSVSQVQLKFLNIHITFKKALDSTIVDAVKKHSNAMADGTLKSIRDMSGDLYLTKVGSRSSHGMSLYPVALIPADHDTEIDISPTKMERLNLRRRPCRNYAEEDHTLCLFNAIRRTYAGCRLILPPERWSRNFSECSYILRQAEMSKYLLHLFATMDGAIQSDECPKPCVDNSAKVTYGFKRKTGSNGTHFSARITFRQLSKALALKEYRLVTTTQMYSSIGGTLGLYFGVSILSLVQLLALLADAVAKAESCGCRKAGDTGVRVQ